MTTLRLTQADEDVDSFLSLLVDLHIPQPPEVLALTLAFGQHGTMMPVARPMMNTNKMPPTVSATTRFPWPGHGPEAPLRGDLEAQRRLAELRRGRQP